MSDPRRFVEERGLAGSLLRAGEEEQPSREAVRRTAIAVAAGATVASSSAAAGGATVNLAKGAAGSVMSKAAAPFTLVVMGKWVAVGTLAGLVTVTAVSQVDRVQSRSVAAQALARAAPSSVEGLPVNPPAVPIPNVAPIAIDVPPPPASDTRPTLSASRTDSPRPSSPPHPARGVAQADPRGMVAQGRAEPAESALPPPSMASAEASAEPPPPSRPSSDEVSPALSPEIAFVDQQWQAVQSGGYVRALVDLARYEDRFPDLRLYPEVLFLRMQAESHLGHSANAAALARQIVATYPKSAQAARARSILSAQSP